MSLQRPVLRRQAQCYVALIPDIYNQIVSFNDSVSHIMFSKNESESLRLKDIGEALDSYINEHYRDDDIQSNQKISVNLIEFWNNIRYIQNQ